MLRSDKIEKPNEDSDDANYNSAINDGIKSRTIGWAEDDQIIMKMKMLTHPSSSPNRRTQYTLPFCLMKSKASSILFKLSFMLNQRYRIEEEVFKIREKKNEVFSTTSDVKFCH